MRPFIPSSVITLSNSTVFRISVRLLSLALVALVVISCSGGGGAGGSDGGFLGGGNPGGALSISGPTSFNGQQAMSSSVQLSASGGTAPYSWSLMTGWLPPGLTLNTSTGLISGTPTASGTFQSTVRLTDSTGQFTEKQFTAAIAPGLSIVVPSQLNGSSGQTYAAQFTATGGTPPYKWTVPLPPFAGTSPLPPGLSFNSSTGLISGTPTASGSYTFNVQLTDSAGGLLNQTFTIVIANGVNIATTSLSNPSRGVAYATQLTATGGTAPYTWSVTAGSLPLGLNLDSSTGAISGTPVASGSFQFTIKVTDSTANSAQQSYTVNVGGGPSISSVLPYSATINGGVAVTITGQQFVSGATVSFGGVAATNVSVGGFGTTITATVPAHAAGKADIVVTNPDTNMTVFSQGFLYADVAGCGTDCGNVGDPYEGGPPPQGQTPISACNTKITLGGNYVLTQNIGTDPTAACLSWFYPGSSINLDLGGHTVTGQIDMSGTNHSPNVIFNGTINCQTGGGCLQWATSGRIHHLSITNSAGLFGATGSIGINVVGTESSSAPFLKLRLDHNTVVITATPNVNRTQAIRNDGSSGSDPAIRSMSTEIDHNNLTCSDNASSCQGVELYASAGSFIHHNAINLPAVCSLCSDSARGTIFDGSTGEFAFNTVNTNANRGVRVRSFPSSATVPVHDNAFLNVLTPGRLAAVHIGENDNNLSTINVPVYGNTFELGPGGNGVVSSAATNVFVRNNTVSCLNGDCSAVGFFAETDVPAGTYATTGTNITVSDNNVNVLTSAGKPAVKVCQSPGTAGLTCGFSATQSLQTSATVCNSGTAVGNGKINLVSPPCP